jgi:hypothetical protein
MNPLGRILLPAAATALVALALPAMASATDYCVHTSCGGTHVDSIEKAFGEAAMADDADRVFLGDGVYTAQTSLGFSYGGSGPIELVGAGQQSTVLTAPPGNGAVLTLQGGAGTSVHDLTIKLPEYANGQGLYTLNDARRIQVTEDSAQSHPREGVRLIWGGTLEDSVVTLPRDDSNTTAVSFGAGGGTIRRSTINAATGVLSWYGDSTIEGSWVTGTDYAVRALNKVTNIRSSWIRMAGLYGTGIRADTQAASTTVNADGVTVTTQPAPDVVGVGATTSLAPAQSAQVNLTNSIVRGGGAPLWAGATGPGEATVAASYSDYDPTFNNTSGDKARARIIEANVSNVGDEGFVAGLAHRLLPTSNLIDAGDPATPQGLDFDDNPLVADGNGDGIARRDLGAFELQPEPVDGGGQAGGGGPAADITAPLVSGFRASPATFAIGRARTAVAARTARGTRLRYTLSEPARVTVAIKRAVRRGGHIRYRMIGALKRTGKSGANSIRFTGRIGKRALRPGRYRAVIRAADPAGNRSAPKTIRMRIAGSRR